MSKHDEAPLYLCRCVVWIMVNGEKIINGFGEFMDFVFVPSQAILSNIFKQNNWKYANNSAISKKRQEAT